MATVAVFIFSVFTHLLLLYSAESCPPSFCNETVARISFPFKNTTPSRPECGFYTLDCSDHLKPKIQLKDGGYWFQLESTYRSDSVFINDGRLQERIGRLKGDTCDDDVFNDLSLPGPTPIFYTHPHNLTLFKCNKTPPYKGPNYACTSVNHIYYNVSNPSLNCSAIQIPIRPGFPSNVYNASALTAKFSLHFNCLDDHGEWKCGPPPQSICWNQTGEFICPPTPEGKCQDEEDGKCAKDITVCLALSCHTPIPFLQRYS